MTKTALHALVCVWPPAPVLHDVTAVAGSDEGSGYHYTGAADGSIARWETAVSSLAGNTSSKSSVTAALQPTLLLKRHQRPVRALLPGLKSSSGGGAARHLLSIDAGGLCCLWEESTGRCVASDHLEMFPGDAHPSVLLLVSLSFGGCWLGFIRLAVAEAAIGVGLAAAFRPLTHASLPRFTPFLPSY